ncbi:MAG: hypothetical protein WD795_01125 [Woeseia sp.]
MSAGNDWTAHIEKIAGGFHYRISQGNAAMSFRELFGNLESNARFSSWYADLLGKSPLAAYFWEHPALSAQTYDRAAEFVLIDGSHLVGLSPDPSAFRSQFESARTDVAIFTNLGGDATLLAPCPVGSLDSYTHLARFVRFAPAQQREKLWHHTGRLVREHVRQTPFWLSTSGLGVSWLHVRLDQYPKYYQYLTYKQSAWSG